MADADRPAGGDAHPDTQVVSAGRDPMAQHGVVNPPVYHASTILFPDAHAMRHPERVASAYGRRGTPGTFALEDAMLDLEGAEDGAACRMTPSGLAAVTLPLLAYTRAGAHVLVPDNAYDPTRIFCDGLLKTFGVETTYYDPLIGADIRGLFRPETAMLLMETPGSRTFEMSDVPAMTAVAKEHGITTALDNTWASPLFFKPFAHGVDVSIHAATKFIVGHSDALLGLVTARKSHAARLVRTQRQLGFAVGPDDVYLAQRGLRTLAVRMRQHMASGLAVAQWLQARPDVSRVLYPALPEDPGHALWARDFSGASGVFGFVLKGGEQARSDAFLNGMRLFGLGYSFGGYESLIVPTDVSDCRTVTPWQPEGSAFRVHIGLEDPRDLIADLERAFERFHAAGG